MKRIFLVLILLFSFLPLSEAAQWKWPYGIDSPNDFQIQFDYGARTDGQPVYVGYGKRTDATTDGSWLIFKFTYDGNDFISLKQTAYGVWDNRASLTYE